MEINMDLFMITAKYMCLQGHFMTTIAYAKSEYPIVFTVVDSAEPRRACAPVDTYL